LVVLLGIAPETPEIDYGWIQPGTPFPNARTKSLFHVSRFWEKPSQPLACSLINLGCLWNSFIMVGRVQAFLDLTRRTLPVLFRSFCAITSSLAVADRGSLNRIYSQISTVNFSQEVLSVCPKGLAVLRADGLGWSDLGEPGRVLSILARKGLRTEWKFG